MAFVHEHLILPLSDLLTGHSVHRQLRFIHRSQQWSDDETLRFQVQRLQLLVGHALPHVPFYRDWNAQNGSIPGNIGSLDDLRRLPIVDKQLMQSEGIARFTAEGFPPRELVRSSSSGSTGAPFRFYTTRLASSVNTAAKIATWQQAGYRIGDRYVKIAYAARPRLKRLQDRANNSCYLQFRSPADDDMSLLLHQVAGARPTVIRAHANIAYYLAVAQLRLHLDLHPRLVMTTATTLTPAYRATIAEAFPGCDIIDSYSCEGTPCMAETPQHDGYHICHAYGIAELLDAEGDPVRDGLARVVATDLWNLGHPFIRYDTRDVVEVRDGRVVRIAGRANEQFTAANGRIFTGYAVGDYFTHEQCHIDGYQIAARQGQPLLIRLVPGRGFQPDQAAAIAAHWQAQTGQPVEVELCRSLPLTASGKHRTILND